MQKVPKTSLSIGEYLIQRLHAHGVRHVFGIPAAPLKHPREEKAVVARTTANLESPALFQS
jgi:hypothetical protein